MSTQADSGFGQLFEDGGGQPDRSSGAITTAIVIAPDYMIRPKRFIIGNEWPVPGVA
jgi:hypothetical protein